MGYVAFVHLGEASKKINCFFSEKLRKGGGGVSPNPKFPYQKKLRYFWIFFFKRGGVSHIPKGCYHKELGILGYFCQKGGSHPIHRDFFIKNWKNFGISCRKRGGVLPIPKFPYQKKLGPPNCWEGAGGSQSFGVFLKNTSFFLLMPPLTAGIAKGQDAQDAGMSFFKHILVCTNSMA